MSKKCEIKSYIKNITNDENVREQLNDVHNKIFDRLHKSKLFDMWNQILFEHPNNISKINDGRRLVGAINSEYGTPVVGWTKTPTNRQHVYVNVKNLLPKYTNNPNQRKLFSLKENDVNQGIKAIDILQSDKAKQIFDKGEKNKWDLNKILIELAISKYQKELILGLNKTNREEIVTDLLANYSYTVEINTAKEKLTGKIAAEEGMYVKEENGKYYLVDAAYSTKNEISKQEYEDFNNNKQIPTKHYSNLTVPGGTNYTENEISTPAITPSIKGHAQFATDNGIGWFRSDEKSDWEGKKITNINEIPVTKFNFTSPLDYGGETIVYYKKNNQWFVEGGIDNDENGNLKPLKNEWVVDAYNTVNGVNIGNPTKTRRILEVQSDLFQKGRDKENLVLKEISKYNANEEDGDIHPLLNNEELEDFDANEFLYKNPSDEIIGTRDWGYGTVKEDDDYYYFESGDNKYSKISKEKYEQEKIKFAKLEQEQLKNTREKAKKLKENQFLQLLNKDNNWVTFFVKSIIQDTAKQTITEVQESDVEAKVRELEKEGLLEIDCKGKLKAEKGLVTSFTKGGKWKIIKDLKGYPTHKEGGIDLTIGKDGVSIKNGNAQFTAKHGLVIPKN